MTPLWLLMLVVLDAALPPGQAATAGEST